MSVKQRGGLETLASLEKIAELIALILVGGTMLWGTVAVATPYQPQSPNELVAHWAYPNSQAVRNLQTQRRLQPDNLAVIAPLAQTYLQQAAQPGQGQLYGLTEALLKPAIESGKASAAIWLAWAQVMQHQHLFPQARDALQQVFRLDPGNISAILMAARIALIQQNPQGARGFCLRLLGLADLLTISACSLEASSYGDKQSLRDSYVALQQMVKSQGLPDDSRRTWVIQILADMAQRLGDPEQAVALLETQLKPDASVSYWMQWANARLLLGRAEDARSVLARLGPIVEGAASVDDTLALRLAIAEKQLGVMPIYWQKLLSERIQLREDRQDTAHAADLAIYYLDVVPKPAKALHWAQINWRYTREPFDQTLLARAQSAVAGGE